VTVGPPPVAPESGSDLLGRLRRGEISSAEVTETYLARIEEHDGELRSFVTVAAESARARALAADQALERGDPLGPLHGLPIALKDNIDTAALRTTVGSRFFEQRVPAEDADVARRLREAGAVLVGKTALHEFALGATTQNPHHGACRNPWDSSRIPGGSSGGSGAAVAAGFCAAALGTDTGGSVRIPAALNGVTGLRPTLGRVSNRGVFPVSWSLDVVGPLARSVVDVAGLLTVIGGFDPDDPGSVDGPVDDYLSELDLGIDGLRIGVPQTFYFADVDEEVEQAVRAAAEVLAASGADVEEIGLDEAAEAYEATSQIIRAEALAVHRERLEGNPELFGEDLRRRLPLGYDVTGAEYAAHRETGRAWVRTVERAFERTDIILTPVTETVAPRADESETIETTRRLTRLTYGWSLAGGPSLALPCGFSGDGLPIGVQLTAPKWKEARLLKAGAAYQRETDWHLREPKLASTGTPTNAYSSRIPTARTGDAEPGSSRSGNA
jgi:aspartyl-tRNA(Asn)/glutamyl-tRNA(Gln) amidotransferase subunit A